MSVKGRLLTCGKLRAQSHKTQFLKAQLHQKRLGKNALGKTGPCACGADLTSRLKLRIFLLLSSPEKRKKNTPRLV